MNSVAFGKLKINDTSLNNYPITKNIAKNLGIISSSKTINKSLEEILDELYSNIENGKDISKYLRESEEAVNFYYTVEDQSTGIKISFALIYVILVTLLLFLSITIAIRFSSRFFVSINNLITASEQIGKGDLNTKVPDIKTDIENQKKFLSSNYIIGLVFG